MKKLLLFLLCFTGHFSRGQSFEILFGDSASECNATSVIQLPSGNIILLTHCISTAAAAENYLFKFSSSGTLLGQFLINQQDFHAEKMKLLPDGHLIIAGSVIDSTVHTDGLLLKCDTTASIIWSEAFGTGFTNEMLAGITINNSGNIISSGYTKNNSGPGNAIYMVCTDSTGNLLWEKSFSASFNSYADQVIALADQSLMISGDRQVTLQSYSNVVIRTDSAGNDLWDVELQNPFNNGCKNDILTSTGEIIIVGESATSGNPIFDAAISKIDSTGIFHWSHIYSGDPNTTDALFDICEINANRYIAAGYGGNPVTGSTDIEVIQIDSAGNETYRTYIGDTTGLEIAYSIIKSNNGNGVYMCGSAGRNGITKAYLVYRELSTLQNIHTPSVNNLMVYPNPTTAIIYINEVPANSILSIYNLQGTLLLQTPAGNKTTLPSEWKSGIYIIKLESSRTSSVSRLCLIR